MATQDDNNNLWKKAMIAAQMQPINYWSQQGNSAALLGNILGSWLQQYIAKMSDTKDPSPEGEVNADTISQMTQATTPELYGNPAEMATQAMGGYTPPTTLDSVTNNFKDPLGNAGEAHTWDSLKKQIDTNRQMPDLKQAPFFDMSQSSPNSDSIQKSENLTPHYDNYVNSNYDKAFSWNDELKEWLQKYLTNPSETADSEAARMAGEYYNKGLSWEELDPMLRFKSDHIRTVYPRGR